MSTLKLVYGPDPIFRKHADMVTVYDAALSKTLQDMADTLYFHNALGIGANMLGLLQRLVVVDLQEDKKKQLYKMVNPEIINKSSNKVEMIEASLSFPGIKAKIERPEHIEVVYYDEAGAKIELAATGLLARVIQHEVDYLNGITFLDYLSPVKRKILLSKIKKNRRG